MRHLTQTLAFSAVLALFPAAMNAEPVGVDSQISARQSRITAKGVILDTYGQPVIGASVLEKGNSSNGVVADIDGNFTIVVPQGATLVISSIGYTTQEIQASTLMNIVLTEDSTMLEETVVVGYGVQKKESLTGAITAIGSEDITSTKTENLISNIQGKMPGLLIRQKTGEPGVFNNMISVRGYGDPLIVIDGITRGDSSDLAQLNSDDIESISILKDASAAIYGMNAANGVIIVTTKQGKAEKPVVSYTGLVGAKAPTGIESTMDAYTYRVIANERSKNDGNSPMYSDELIEKYRTGEYRDWNWMDMYMKKVAFQQNHNLSVRGGTDNVKYFVSFGYNDDNGLLATNIQYYHRYTFRSNLSANLSKDLTLNVGISGRWTESRQPREDFLWNYKTLITDDRGIGPYTIDPNDPTKYTNHFSNIGPEGKNPAGLIDPDVDGFRLNRALNYDLNVELKYNVPFVKGLTLSALGSFDGYTRNNSTLQKSYDMYDYYTDEWVKTFGQDSYSNTMRIFQKLYGRFMATYSTTFNDAHHLSATAVAEMSGTRSDYLTGQRYYSEIFTNDILDQATAATATNGGNRSFTRLAAYLVRVNYDYKGKYLFEAVGRYDGSYRYAPSRRWTFFPSVSAGWRISEEPFIKNNASFINNLKLRASYGESGVDAGNAFQYIPAYTPSMANSYIFSGSSITTGMYAPGVTLESLSWVTSKIMNIGIDAELWKGRLFGTFEIFQRKNEGMLANRQMTVPSTFGASFPQENINSNLNRGIEFEIGTRGQSGDFTYQITGNFTYARTKNLYVERRQDYSSYDRWKNNSNDRLTGYRWFYQTDGRYESLEEYETAPLLGGSLGNSRMTPGSFKLVDVNGDGIINGDDRLPNGWARGSNPPIQYGLNMAFSWKGLDLNMLFQGASGYTIQYPNDDIWGYGSKTNDTYLVSKYESRWHTTDPSADPYDPTSAWSQGTYPALHKNFGNTTDNGQSYQIPFWHPEATYVRLKTLEIGYTFPKALLRKAHISNARVFINGNNLFTICNPLLKNADPEREEADWQASVAYPLMKSYNFGVTLTF